MRKNQLSPVTSVVISLSLLLGILVADLTNVRGVAVAGAQTGGCVRLPSAPVADATVVGTRITATDVLVNGVVTRAAFAGSVRVVDSIVFRGDTTTTNGVFPGVDVSGPNGVFPGVDVSGTNGVFPGVDIAGGVVHGDDVRVVDGLISGTNLRVVGAVVTAGLSGTPISPTN